MNGRAYSVRVEGAKYGVSFGSALAIAISYTTNHSILWAIIQGIFGGSIYGQNPSYLSERFPTEVRATASGFVYHQGAIWGGLIAPVLTYMAVQMGMGFAMPMMISTIFFLAIVIIAVLLGPETKGKKLTADLEVVKVAPQPA